MWWLKRSAQVNCSELVCFRLHAEFLILFGFLPPPPVLQVFQPSHKMPASTKATANYFEFKSKPGFQQCSRWNGRNPFVLHANRWKAKPKGCWAPSYKEPENSCGFTVSPSLKRLVLASSASCPFDDLHLDFQTDPKTHVLAQNFESS